MERFDRAAISTAITWTQSYKKEIWVWFIFASCVPAIANLSVSLSTEKVKGELIGTF